MICRENRKNQLSEIQEGMKTYLGLNGDVSLVSGRSGGSGRRRLTGEDEYRKERR